MAFTDSVWYVDYGNGSSTGYYAVTAWSATAAKNAGDLIRQNTTPSVNNEKVFVCVVAGTTGGSEPSWATFPRGQTTTDGTVTWLECTGNAGLNGDATNTPTWTSIKNTSISQGQIIKRDNGASYQICTTSGTAGNGAEPGFSDTAGTTTADNTVTWTSLGVVGNYTGWQAPHARLQSAFATGWGSAGQTFYVASSHAETYGSGTVQITSPGTFANPCKIICVDKLNVPPTSSNIATGATISTTGGNALQIRDGSWYCLNIAFQSGSAGNSASIEFQGNGQHLYHFDTCGFTLNNTGSTSRISLCTSSGGSGAVYALDNCTFTFAASAQKFNSQPNTHDLAFRGGTIVAGASPPSLVFESLPASTLIEAVDMSGFGSGLTIIGNSTISGTTIVKDCKLGASVTKVATLSSNPRQKVIFTRSDSGATNYLQECYTYRGSHIIETTIVRTGGATDGTTPVSWKIVTTSNSLWVAPFECLPLAVWNDTTASNVTVTVYGVWGGGAVPNNDDIWFDVEYLGSSSTPLGTVTTITKADLLATGSALTSDTSTWGGSTTKFKMTKTLSSPQPGMKGPIYVTIKAAKPSSTFYIDPKIYLS